MWLGATDNFANAAYWSDGIPTADDVLLFSPSAMQVDRWTTVTGTNTNCTFPQVGDANYLSSYAGIHVINGYSGTITFPANVSFGDYFQTCGATAQTAGKTLTVTSQLFWTGGAVNNTSNLATYTLDGVVSGQIGTDDTTLSSGSEFVLDGSTTVTQSGTLNLGNDADIEVKVNALFIQRRITLSSPKDPKINGYENTDSGGVMVWGRYLSEKGKVKYVRVEAGRILDVEVNSTNQYGGLKVTGKPLAGNWSVTSKGKIFIRNGQTLKAEHGVYVMQGDLYSYTAPAPAQQIATIDGRLRFEGDEIKLGLANTAPDTSVQTNAFSTLLVTKKAELWGGTFQPKLNENNVTERDNIETQDKFSISEFTILPQSVAPVMPTKVLVSFLGFVDTTEPINGSPLVYDMGFSPLSIDWEVKKK